MSKTPLTDVEEFLARRDHEGTLLRVVSSYFTRKLETDRAELVEALRMLLDSIDGNHLTVGDCNEARALLAKLEDKHG